MEFERFPDVDFLDAAGIGDGPESVGERAAALLPAGGEPFCR